MSTDNYAISIVEPIAITDTMLLSSNVPETDYAAWSSATTYAVGARVILTSTHKIYESLQASNSNKNPVTELAWWIEVSPTNRWKALDSSNTSQTVYPSNTPPSISYEIKPGKATGVIGFLNMKGVTEIHVSVTDPVYGLVYSRTEDLSPLPFFASWWSWFFGNRTYTGQQFIIDDLPTYPNATISISLSGNTELAIGVIILGQQNKFSLGMKYGARVGIQDYSRKETNDFGDTVLIQRAFAKRASFELFLDNGEVDQLQNYLASIRAKPVLWVGSNNFESTTVYGFYKNFDILLSYPDHADCSLEIEGLT